MVNTDRTETTLIRIRIHSFSGVAPGGGRLGGTRPPTCPKDRLWDSSRSDEKLVRLGAGYHSVSLDNFGIQNFKMSASEYLRCAPKYTISSLNNQKFSRQSPLPKPLPRRGGGHPLPAPAPYPLGTFSASLLAPSAFVPHSKNPGYAPAFIRSLLNE